ncbi:MAG: LysR substrate-binding domain-containing protein [Acidobacteriaceae bacterium]
MILSNLSLDSLRTLVVTQDLGGFGRASERLLRTPSAISLQMKRLQEEIGVPLFRKQGRKTLLTEQGEIALRYARRVLELNDEMIDTLRGSSLAGIVRIGFAQDFTVNVLPLVIARFNALYPLVKLEVTVDVGQVLLQKVDSGDLDVALTLGGAQKKTAHLLSELPLHWIASPSFRDRVRQPLPLALFSPPCGCQTPGLEALERAGRPWRVAMTSPSLTGLWAAVSAGLGLTTRAELGLPADVQTVDLGLPPLGNIPITLHRRRGLRAPNAMRFAEITEELVATYLRSCLSESWPGTVHSCAGFGINDNQAEVTPAWRSTVSAV